MPSLKKEGKNIIQCDVRKCFSFVWDFILYFRRLHCQVHWAAAETLPKYTSSNSLLFLVFMMCCEVGSKTKSLELKPKMTELWQQWPNLGPFEMCQGWAGLGFLSSFFLGTGVRLSWAWLWRAGFTRYTWGLFGVNRAGALKERHGSGSSPDRCPCSNGNQQFLCFV